MVITVDLQALALQGDVTRVVTFQLARETSGRTYPEIGVPDPHPPLSHHGNDPAKIARMAKINQFHVSLFAYYLERLAATREADGSLLDHSLLLYGSGRTIWANPLGPHCSFRYDDVLVTEPVGSSYCRGDIVRSFDRNG